MTKNILVAAMLALYTSLLAASESEPQQSVQPPVLLSENQAVAEFGATVASQAMSYAKSVARKDGKVIVSVVVADKLCHVTVDESGDALKAEKIECDPGRYFNN